MFDKVVDIDTCYLMEEPANEIRNAVKAFAIQQNFSFYDARTHEGWLRNMMFRLTTTKQLMINICVGYNDVAAEQLLINFLQKNYPAISTLFITHNPKWNDSIYDLTPTLIWGNGYVLEQLGNYKFKIGPKSFFQTNTQQAQQLYDVTKNFAELNGTQTVYDLYCGTGSIGIYVSNMAKKIIGVETIAEAVEDAKENAALNNISQASFFAGDVIKVCNQSFFEEHGKPDVVITDPPRAGMHTALVQKLLEIESPIIVYVSCNSATQARDLALLSAKYNVTKVQPVDMFPHTHHIENVVQLKLR
jgi:23S rRNA (uracil1939-C5)-methyltransferase